jgi:biotin carboxyl carrier protein
MEQQFTEFTLDDTTYITKTNVKYDKRKKFEGFNKGKVNAFIPGAIRDIFVKPGQLIKQGDILLVLEAMKMKNNLVAPVNGTIKSVLVNSNDFVTKNQLLIEIEQ